VKTDIGTCYLYYVLCNNTK